jgi:hypothetical protein
LNNTIFYGIIFFMSESYERIKAGLSVDLSDPRKQDYVGRLSDLAVSTGMRFSQNFTGEYEAEWPFNSDLVQMYDDPVKGTRRYVSEQSVEQVIEMSSVPKQAQSLRTVFRAVENWCPDYLAVDHHESGIRLGIDIVALPKIARIVGNMRPQPFTWGGDGFYVTSGGQKAFEKFYATVFASSKDK